MRPILISTCILLLISSHSSGKTWKVKSNESIQSTLDAAADGDTVLVEPGIYKEKNLVVNHSIVLKGISYPVLDGEKKYEIVSIRADKVVLDGFKIQHSGNGTLDDPSGIKIYDRRNVSIINNILDDNFFGIYAQYSSNCIVRNNKLTAYAVAEQQIGNGIHFWKCDSMQVRNNTIKGHRDGIYFEFVTNSVIQKNLSIKNIRYGLHFMFSNNDMYLANTFRNNGAGVAVMYTNGVKMFNNLFYENWGDAAYGLLLKDITDSYIRGNKFISNTSGIYMEGASRIRMENNIFRNNGWAMKIQASCMDINVSNNNFLRNTFDVGTNGTLVLNTFNANYWDKYEGYDLNKDRKGDVPFRPVSLFSMIIEKIPAAMMLFRSFMVTLLDKTEKILPGITPEHLKDDTPLMKPVAL